MLGNGWSFWYHVTVGVLTLHGPTFIGSTAEVLLLAQRWHSIYAPTVAICFFLVVWPMMAQHMHANTPVYSYDGITSLSRCSSVSEARKAFVYVNGGSDDA